MRNRLIFILIVSAVTHLYAVSGIGVSLVNANGSSSMKLYQVTDNHVDTSYNVFDYWPTFGNNGFPVAINTHGTHLAVVRWSGNMTNNECWISVLRLSDPSTYVDIAYYGNDNGNEWGSKQICWPQGDWIYFTTASKSKYVYRVNVQTRKIEFIAYINLDQNSGFGAEFKMSAINNRIQLTGGLYFTLQELQSAPNGVLNTNQWPDGAFTIQGCGHTISPSGNVMGNQVDPGHCLRFISQLDWNTRQITGNAVYSARDRNLMSVDRDDPFLACSLLTDPCTGSDSGFIETIGVGQTTTGNSFAVNSDKWECLVSGWFPDGRELGYGGNFILFNPFDSISLNVTRIPRKRADGIVGACQVDAGSSGFAANPSFFVSAPIDDILPELRADAASDYTVPGLDDNTQFPSLTIMPATPYSGWPIDLVKAVRQPARITNKTPAIRFSGSGEALSLRLDFGRLKGRHAVKVFNSLGKLVTERFGDRQTETFTRRDGLRPGLYIFNIRSKGRTTMRSFLIP